MIESSMMVNDRMPEYCVERANKVLNRYQKSISGSRILVLGVVYKKDIDDYRESAALRVFNELEKEKVQMLLIMILVYQSIRFLGNQKR
jgi:UDP-N-acetyl-D-glucosamine dehydrogenase